MSKRGSRFCGVGHNFLPFLILGFVISTNAKSDSKLLDSTYQPVHRAPTRASRSQAAYEIEFYRYEGLGIWMREELLYQLHPSSRKLIQSRIFVDSTNELREAAFLNQSGKWQYDPATDSPYVLGLVERANRAVTRRIQLNQRPELIPEKLWDQRLAPGRHVVPVVDFTN